MTVSAPAWVRPGAKYDLDFANARYWGGSVDATAFGAQLGLITGAIAAASFAPDAQGIYHPFGTYAPRITSGCGLWAECDSTNSALWCRDLTNAVWVKTGCTAAKNQPGADLTTNAASALTAGAANATALQSITLGSATTVVTSALVKRLTGTGAIALTQDGTTYTPITGLINTGGYTKVQVPAQSLTSLSVGFQLAVSGDSIAVDFVQSENNTVATTPLPTTSATSRRFNEEPCFNTTGSQPNDGYRLLRTIFANGSPISMVAAYSGAPNLSSGNTPSAYGYLISSDGFPQAAGGCDGRVFYSSGVTSTNTGNAGLGNVNKVATRNTANSASVALNGVLTTTVGAQNLPTQGNGITHIGIGNNGSGNGPGPLNGYISRITLWDREITDGQMIEWTR